MVEVSTSRALHLRPFQLPRITMQSFHHEPNRMKSAPRLSKAARKRLWDDITDTGLIPADEVQAIVLDPGYATTRCGFAGEDTPKSVIPTFYGAYSEAEEKKYIFGDDVHSSMRSKLEVKNPMNEDGLVEDWEVAEKLWEYSFTSRLTGAKPSDPLKNGLNDPSDAEVDIDMVEQNEKPLCETPLIMTDAGWNTAKAREKMIEIAMESWDAPAFFVIRSGVAAA